MTAQELEKAIKAKFHTIGTFGKLSGVKPPTISYYLTRPEHLQKVQELIEKTPPAPKVLTPAQMQSAFQRKYNRDFEALLQAVRQTDSGISKPYLREIMRRKTKPKALGKRLMHVLKALQ